MNDGDRTRGAIRARQLDRSPFIVSSEITSWKTEDDTTLWICSHITV